MNDNGRISTGSLSTEQQFTLELFRMKVLELNEKESKELLVEQLTAMMYQNNLLRDAIRKKNM